MSEVRDSYTLGMRADGGKRVSAELTSVGAAGKKSFKMIEDAAAQTTFGMRLMTRFMINTLIPSLGALELSRSLFANIKAIEQTDARLKRLSTGAEDFAKIQGYLKEKSAELNIGILTLSDSYAKLLSLQDGGLLNRAEVNALTEGFANAKAAIGLDDTRIGDVLYGLSQALGQGTVQAQELNQVMEPIPILLNKVASAAGVSQARFREMVKDGKVSSEALKNYILTALKDFDGAAAAISGTLTASVTKMSNAWVDAARAAADSRSTESIIIMSNALADSLVYFTQAAEGTQKLSDVTNEMELAFFLAARSIKLAMSGVADAVLRALTVTSHAIGRVLDVARRTANHLPFVDIPHYSGFERLADNLNRGAEAAQDDFKEALGFGSGPSQKDIDAAQAQFAEMRKNLDPKVRNKGIPALRKDSSSSAPASFPVPTAPPSASDSAGKQAADDAKRAAQAIRDVTDALKFKTEQLGRTESEQELYNNLQRAGVDLDSAAGREIAALSASYDLMSKAIAQNRAEMERIQRTADAVGDAFASAFEKAALEGDSLRSVIYGLAKDIEAMFFRSAVSEPLKAAISGGVSSLLGAGSFAVSSGNPGAAFRTALNPGLYGPGFASGGSFTVRGNGGTDTTPVSFWATRGEKVTVETPGQKKAGGDTIINIDLRGSNGEASIEAAVRRGIAQAAPQIVNASVRTMVDKNKRSPGLLR